jgi:hypothetical protein
MIGMTGEIGVEHGRGFELRRVDARKRRREIDQEFPMIVNIDKLRMKSVNIPLIDCDPSWLSNGGREQMKAYLK